MCRVKIPNYNIMQGCFRICDWLFIQRLGPYVEHFGNYNLNNLILNFDRMSNNLYFHHSSSSLVDVSTLYLHFSLSWSLLFPISYQHKWNMSCSMLWTNNDQIRIWYKKHITCMDWTGYTCIGKHVCKVLLMTKCVDSCAKLFIYMSNHTIHTTSSNTNVSVCWGIIIRPKVVYVCISILNQPFI